MISNTENIESINDFYSNLKIGQKVSIERIDKKAKGASTITGRICAITKRNIHIKTKYAVESFVKSNLYFELTERMKLI